jgi:hypothetical protein
MSHQSADRAATNRGRSIADWISATYLPSTQFRLHLEARLATGELCPSPAKSPQRERSLIAWIHFFIFRLIDARVQRFPPRGR